MHNSFFYDMFIYTRNLKKQKGQFSPHVGIYRSGLLDTLQQLNRNIGAFNPHHAFLGTSVTQKIDAAVPYDTLVDDGEFLVDAGAEQDVDAFFHQKIQSFLHERVIFFREILFSLKQSMESARLLLQRPFPRYRHGEKQRVEPGFVKTLSDQMVG